MRLKFEIVEKFLRLTIRRRFIKIFYCNRNCSKFNNKIIYLFIEFKLLTIFDEIIIFSFYSVE